MLQRYDYREHTLTVSADVFRDDDEIERSEDIEGYAIYDRQGGNSDDKWVAFGLDHDQIERIVDLLNASDEKRKEPK
jgi:hypothetical protein